MIARFEATAVREHCHTITLYCLLLAWILMTSGAIFLMEWCLWLLVLDLAVLLPCFSLFLAITGALKVAQWFSEDVPLTFTLLIAIHKKGERIQIREGEASYTPIASSPFPLPETYSSASPFLYDPQHEHFPSHSGVVRKQKEEK